VNTAFPFAVGITLCDDNTTDYVFESSPVGFGPLPVSALDGQKVEFFVRYPDNTTSGYEPGWGVYTHSTRTITRDVIGQSSAGDGVAVNWGSSAPKYLVMVASGASLANMARIFLALEPWEDILAGSTTQSNGGTLAYYQGTPPADTDRVLDWSRAEPGTGSEAWRQVVKAEEYTDYDDAVPYVGTPRSIEVSSVWTPLGSINHAFATQLAALTGRRVRTVHCFRGATSLADPTYGWLYNPSATNSVAKVFADAVDAAITQMHTDDPRQSSVTKLHVYIMAHGENDALAGESGSPFYGSSSARYGRILADHIEALRDPDRWNIADENTVIILNDIPEPLREKESSQSVGVNEFDGHAQAQALIGSRCFVVSTAGIPTQDDQIHYWGEGADELGVRDANTLLTPSASNANFGGAFRLAKVNTWPLAIYAWETDSASAPSSSSWRFNVAQNELKIHNTTAALGDMVSRGLGHFQIGDLIRMERQDNAAIYVDIRITGAAVNNTTYFTYPCDIEAEAGTRTATSFLLLPQNTGWHDGEAYVAATPHRIQSAGLSLANPETDYTGGAGVTSGAEVNRDFHYLMARAGGIMERSAQLAVRSGSRRTTDATANQTLLRSYHFEDGRVEYINAKVCYKVPANGNVGVFDLHAIIRRTGTTTSADWAPAATVLVDEEALATDPNIVALTFSGVLEGWIVRVTGKAATTIDWICEVETIEIPTLA
jgi:hypothetical protein